MASVTNLATVQYTRRQEEIWSLKQLVKLNIFEYNVRRLASSFDDCLKQGELRGDDW